MAMPASASASALPALRCDDTLPAGGARPSAAPEITFAIPAYNRPQLLAETLASLRALKNAGDCEILVCDDGGLPETRALVSQEAAENPPVYFFPNTPALGAVGNWNRCLCAARGRWVMVLHEDDALYPWYLDAVRPHLRDGVAAVATKAIQGSQYREPAQPALPVRSTPYLPHYFIKGAMTPFPGILIRADLARKLGGFDDTMGPLADYEFWYRLSAAGEMRVVNVPGAFYRVSPEQWTSRVWPRMIRLTHLLRLRIAREQLPGRPRLGRWLARFFSARNARSYAERFTERPAPLVRALRLERIPFAFLPSGWVWAALRRLSRG
jgi:glycosyltransferase involved in cell wall biosynthesis